MKQIIFAALYCTCCHLACTSEKQIHRNIITAIDLSGSRSDSAIVAWASSTVQEHVIANMGQKDKLVVTPIDYASSTSTSEIYEVDFSSNIYTNEYAGLDEDKIAMQSHADSLAEASMRFAVEFQQEIVARKRYPSGTDVFGALKTIRLYYSEGYQNTVILLSDMLHNAESFNLQRSIQQGVPVDSLLAKSPSFDLSGFSFTILTGEQARLSPTLFAQVQTFWEKYIRKNGGKALGYGSKETVILDRLFTSINNL